jgi:hypothetical protein
VVLVLRVVLPPQEQQAMMDSTQGRWEQMVGRVVVVEDIYILVL